MLEKVDLSKRMGKEEFKEVAAELRIKLGMLQRQARDAKLPVVLVFEGLDASDKGTLINELIQTFDPRGFDVFAMRAPGEEEASRPYFWRFWTKTPARGRIAVFYRSWYRHMIVDRLDEHMNETDTRAGFHSVRSFERQLADDGNLIIKIFLHISKKEQRERLKKLADDSATSWQVTDTVWKRNHNYDKYLKAVEETIGETDADYAPWTIVEAHDKRFATAKIMITIADALQAKLNDIAAAKAVAQSATSIVAAGQTGSTGITVSPEERKLFNSSILANLDSAKTVSEEEYQEKLKKYQEKIREYEAAIYYKRLPIAIVFEGWDAAGKGGSIRRLTETMDPRGYTVIPTGAPNDEEKAHHYLWRFWKASPPNGHVTIFDRSWYGRVLVERVENLCCEHEWKRAYQEINEMEQQWVHHGIVLLKFWLQIDKEEQRKRFEERLASPEKQWKITGEDWRNREKWSQYESAVDEMFFRTSTTNAPWTIVEANSKQYARIKILEKIIDVTGKYL